MIYQNFSKRQLLTLTWWNKPQFMDCDGIITAPFRRCEALLFYAPSSIAGATPAGVQNWTIGSPNNAENGQTLQRLKYLLLPLYRRLSMKTEELTALGLTEDQVKQVFALNGKDVEAAKAAKDKTIADLTAERDGLKTRLDTAETTLKKFEGIDPQQIQQEIQTYKTQAEDAEKKFAREITQRDQKDWITKRLDEYGVTSPFARTALVSECMSPDAGLTWKDGAFFGFDDFMKAAKQKDAGLYQTAEEKEAAEKAAKQKEKAPAFTGPTGDPGTGSEKYTPPKIF